MRGEFRGSQPLIILAIEDDTEDVTLLRRFLDGIPDTRFQVLHARTGILGEAMLAENPDIVIAFLDYSLGHETGIEVVERIREAGDSRPVVMLTGTEDPKVAADSIRAGADDYLLKRDLTSDSLRLAIEGALERQRLTEEKALLAAQLNQSQKMEAIGTLAGGIAHDFNNMLTGIMGFLELAILKSQGRDIERDLRYVHTSCEKMAELIQRLLTFSHHQEISGSLVDLNQSLRELEVILSHTVPKEVTLDISLPDRGTCILGHSSQLHQVFLNLCINAAQAMPEGGNLTIRCDRVSQGDFFPDGAQPNRDSEYIVVEVTDTGTGIPLKIRDRIFEPFFTTKNMGARKGTGLGLAVTWQIVKEHGGFIDVFSEEGKGTTFRIFFPTAMEESGATEEAIDYEIPSGSETLLLVDDEKLVREVSSEILTQLGYRVLTAVDGFSALEIFRNHVAEIRLVILDLSMPRMGGRECMKRFREIDPSIPVLCSSGHHMESERSKLQREGATDVIQKPFRLEQLAQTIRQVIDGKSSGAIRPE